MEEPRYAELHAHSVYTFLEGANTPSTLTHTAAKLGLSALSILDVDGMYSVVQTAAAGKKANLPIVYGTELTLHPSTLETTSTTDERTRLHPHDPGIRLPVLATSQEGYRNLCELLSTHFLAEEGRRKAALTWEEIKPFTGNLFALTGTMRGPLRRALARNPNLKDTGSHHGVLEQILHTFGHSHVGIETHLQPHDPPELADQLAAVATRHDLPLVATGAVRCASPRNQPLADVLTATRMRMSLDEAEPHLPAWRTFLRSPQEMLDLHHRHPEAVVNAADLAQQFSFDFNILEPGLPHYDVPEGHTEATWLRHLTYLGAKRHYGSQGKQPKAWKQIEHELRIIEQLGFPGYFLIVKDIVDFCKTSGILCQGRGSAANSAVCYALEITAVDAVKHKMLFERFLSPDRVEAPDIDLDIEAGERERVIQYVYTRYGRTNAALVANVISYRPKSAIRDAGTALGFPEGQVNRWSKFSGRSHRSPLVKDQGALNGIPPLVVDIAANLQKIPRHMGIHPGGMVLTRTPVSQVCPVRWGAMPGRSVLQWDKEDCADAGLVKFDLLGLGMLTALRRSFTWLEENGVTYGGRPLDLHNLPEEDPRVYDLLCAAETVGVFQVESRAQMNTLPRLKPRVFYDIVIEVALIRPGPIQGNAVSPYLRRKNGREPVTYLHPLMESALKKTLGVPLFQEQLMQIAVDVAGFSPGQADELRRAIGSKRSSERMTALKPALFEGMSSRGVKRDIQERVFEQLRGFAEFGFPESHAFSFAYLVYASAWLKVHYPEHFYAAILASQPMGFYSPASLIEDARRHGVRVLPPSVEYSQVVATPVESSSAGGEVAELDIKAAAPKLVQAHPNWVVRLGLESVKGLGVAAERIVSARREGGFRSVADLAARAELNQVQMEKLAAAGALGDLGVSRREGLWAAGPVSTQNWHQPFLPGTEVGADAPTLGVMTPAEEMLSDYASMGLTTGGHPLSFVRAELDCRGIIELKRLPDVEDGVRVQVAGLITHRQRPQTAAGTTFLSLEDETGLGNVICSPGLWKRYRTVALESQAMVVRGRIEKGDGAVALVADRLETLSLPVTVRSRDFR